MKRTKSGVWFAKFSIFELRMEGKCVRGWEIKEEKSRKAETSERKQRT